MYESFYGLNEKPFNLNPDSEYLYMSSGHENAYTHLLYAISENKGFVIITGEIGSGKTTLINYLLNEIGQDIQVGLINNTYLSPTQFVRTLCREFEVPMDAEITDKSILMEHFHGFLIDQFSNRRRVVLIVDEAQNLTPKTMEEIRMLSNLESEKNHLIQIILVGQPELKYKLQRSDLKQFAQRVTVHCHLSALNQAEVEEYVKYRLRIAGGKNVDLFDKGAVEAIAKYSRGIPRLINILCDTALVYGFAEARDAIDSQIVEDVVRERAAGGIFMPESGTETNPGSAEEAFTGHPRISPNPPDNVSGLIQSRVELIEKRMDHLESVLRGLSNQLQASANKRDAKDNLLIELFKLLKQSMDSRMNTLLRIAEFQENERGRRRASLIKQAVK